MTNIAVVGGAGYIGSHVCKLLSQRGYTPVTIDNFESGWHEAVAFGPRVEMDIRDTDGLTDALRKYDPKAVMHFAALIEVGESTRDPAAYWDNNVMGTFSLLEAMRRSGCNQLVFSSTCAVNAVPDGTPIGETSPVQPQSPYGSTKAAAESLIANFCSAYDLRAVRFRYFNVAGADEDAELGEFHQPETHLLPLVLQAAAGKRSALSIFGNDYPTRDGTCIRDYIHVQDLAEAHVAALDYLDKEDRVPVVCLGTGTGTSVLELMQETERTLGQPVPYNIVPRRPGDPPVLVSGSALAAQELGWVPKRSTPDRIITDAWRWHQGPGFRR